MPKLLEEIKHTVEVTIPEIEDLPEMLHPKADYAMLIIRNISVGIAAVLFIVSFFLHGQSNVLKAIAYFTGAGAYLFECLVLTDCFRKKVEHKEMFMVYCLGPLYILMGINYILWH